MSRQARIINIAAFVALFATYAVPLGDHPLVGVRRMLQTYAGQLPTGATPTDKPVWELGIGWTDAA